MNKLDQKIDNFLNLNYSDLDDYYKYATEIDINNLRVLLKGYAETENERNIFKKLGDEEVMRKIKSMGIFYTNNPKNIPLHNTKYSLFRKDNNKYLFYLIKHNKNLVIMRLYRILKKIDRSENINDFSLTCYNNKFVPKETNKTEYKILGMSYKKGYSEIPFISYYILSPHFIDPKDKKLSCINFWDFYKLIIEKEKRLSDSNFEIIPKGVFRGAANNTVRKNLFKINSQYIDAKQNDYIPFIDNLNYKYIIDLWGNVGHCGRRFFLPFFNRVLFFPKEDENKQFFELGENKMIPNEHYVEYSVHNLDEISTKIKYLEENPEEYERIRNNCLEYSNKYLSKEYVFDFIRKTLE